MSMPASAASAERAELIVFERPAHERDALQLPLRCGDQARVAVAEVDGRVSGQHVQVPPAVHIGDPGALGLGDYHR
jgi:hypothetical protein